MRLTPDVDLKVAKELELPMYDERRMIFEITPEDYLRYKNADQDDWTEITDQETQRVWLITSAPCGGGCHCAAFVKPKEVADV